MALWSGVVGYAVAVAVVVQYGQRLDQENRTTGQQGSSRTHRVDRWQGSDSDNFFRMIQ